MRGSNPRPPSLLLSVLLALSITGTVLLVVLAGLEALVSLSVILAAVAQVADVIRRDGP